MNIIKSLFITVALLATTFTVSAEIKTATLTIEGMTCASCPYQVKKALTDVKGVKEATATLETREASVTYDDTQTNVIALTEATGNAGFPSTLKVIN